LSADLFERHLFEKSLRFASPEDEAEYRRREAEARRYIEEQLARHTPEGELNAGGALVGQMLDAHDHGAGADPGFMPRWNKLVETIQKQRAALRAEGRSTEEFDRNLVAAVRHSLKAKGLTDAEIDARLAASADPLDAVKPYLATEKDARGLIESASRATVHANFDENQTLAVTAASTGDARTAIAERSQSPTGIDDVMAKLQGSGVVAAAQKPEDGFAHGLSAQDRATSGRSSPAV
jgi:hypothetical protein